jgi:hypothetical protein
MGYPLGSKTLSKVTQRSDSPIDSFEYLVTCHNARMNESIKSPSIIISTTNIVNRQHHAAQHHHKQQ